MNRRLSATRPAPRTGAPADNLAVGGLVSGVVGLLFLPVVLGPLALALGAGALRRTRAHRSAGMAKAAIVLGVVDLVLFVLSLAALPSGGGWTTAR
jgi:Domain of unknown function (DUF4190)